MTDISKEAVLARLDHEWLLSLDPGDITGIVTIRGSLVQSQSRDYQHMLEYLLDYLPLHNVLVAEQFVTRAASFAKTQYAPRVCGALDLMALERRLTVHYQSPQVIKTMLPPAKEFRKAGWEWKSQHEFDALRHAVYYLLTR